MKAEIINKQYWGEVPADEIIGTQAYPGGELFDLLPNEASILDLGCGNGKISEFLAGKGYHVTGIDINQDAIHRNQNKSSKVNYLLGDIMKPLPFEEKSFDAVIDSFTLLNLMPMREKVVSELGRILKPNGIIWVNEPLVSESYNKRYELSRPFVQNDHDFFVLKDAPSSNSVKTSEEMQQLIDDDQIARITHHFTTEELKKLFSDYEEKHIRLDSIPAPNTKIVMNMIIAVYQLK